MSRRILDEAASYQLRRGAECELAPVSIVDDAVAEGMLLLGRAMNEDLLSPSDLADIANEVGRAVYEIVRKAGARAKLEGVIKDRYAKSDGDMAKGSSGIAHLAALTLQQGVMLGSSMAVHALRREHGRGQRSSEIHIADARRRRIEAGVREQKIRALTGDVEAVKWLASIGIADHALSKQDVPVSSSVVESIVVNYLVPHLRDPRTPVVPAAIADRLASRSKRSRATEPEDHPTIIDAIENEKTPAPATIEKERPANAQIEDDKLAQTLPATTGATPDVAALSGTSAPTGVQKVTTPRSLSLASQSREILDFEEFEKALP